MKKKVLFGLLIALCFVSTACGKLDQPTSPGANIEGNEEESQAVYEPVDVTKWLESGKKYEETGNIKLAWAQYIVASYYEPSNLEPKLFEERNQKLINEYVGLGEEPEDECMDEILELVKKEDYDAYLDYYKKWLAYVDKRNKRLDVATANTLGIGFRIDIDNGLITENVTEKTKITEANMPELMPEVPVVYGMENASFYYTLDVETKKVVIYIDGLEVYPNEEKAEGYIGK